MSKKLKQSSLVKYLMENIRDNIYFMDRKGRIILINEAGATWLGFDSPDEVIGKTDLDIFTEDHGCEAYEDEQRIIKTGIPILGKEEKETWADGHETWVTTSKMPLRDDDGTIIGIFGISRDITEHKKAEIRAAIFADENRQFREEMETELQMAAELQKTFFPTSYPSFPEEAPEDSRAVRFCHHHHTKGGVGGDFCSVRKLSDHEAGILMCDVMGHGMRAALGTAIVRAIVEDASGLHQDPAAFLAHMNRSLMPIFRQSGHFLFATACYMVLDVFTGVLRFSIAGHPSPIRFNQTGCSWLADADIVHGPALAITRESGYETYECRLSAGDSIFIYTDGIFEALNRAGEEFSQDRLLESVDRLRAQPLSAVYAGLLNELSLFSDGQMPDDDICMVGFRLDHLLDDAESPGQIW